MWNTISDLLREGWSLDEALHEMTTVRSDIPSLLQWRPAQPRLPPALEQLFKGKGKGKGSSSCYWMSLHGKNFEQRTSLLKRLRSLSLPTSPKIGQINTKVSLSAGGTRAVRAKRRAANSPMCAPSRAATKAIPLGSTKTNSLIRLDSKGPGQAAWALHQVRRPAQIQQPTLRPTPPHPMETLAQTHQSRVIRRHHHSTSLVRSCLSPRLVRCHHPHRGLSRRRVSS